MRRWRVRRGIRFLDERFGRPEWLSRVDPDELDVANPLRCPLAQASGRDFTDAAWQEGFDGGGTFETLRLQLLGFVNVPGESYGRLTATWREEILRLQHLRDSENSEMEILL